VIYTNAVMPIALCKLHNDLEYISGTLMHLTHSIVRDVWDDVWHM